MRSRQPLGYVVDVDGRKVRLNLNEGHRGQTVSHGEGLSMVGQPDDLIAIDGGSQLIVARVQALQFAEAREAHERGVGIPGFGTYPLRQMTAWVVGYLYRHQSCLKFSPEQWHLPTLGAEGFPLSHEELQAVLLPEEKNLIRLGWEARNPSVPVDASINGLLTRHVAVLGSTGQGKTHFVAGLLQQMLSGKASRIVVFDVNGEYRTAFSTLPKQRLRVVVVGRKSKAPKSKLDGTEIFLRIPYYALGRPGLTRLLLPSEKAQMPALRFAIEHLMYVEADTEGARPTGTTSNVLFDDCRAGSAKDGWDAIQGMRENRYEPAARWPHMSALSCLVADSYAIKPARHERDGFLHGHVSPLINRIRALIHDSKFTDVVDVDDGKSSAAPGVLNMDDESRHLVETVFGTQNQGPKDWSITIVDLSQLTKDLMPFVLGSLLELYAAELFKRGPGKSHPTLLALEEAHHYLREFQGDSDTGPQSLAYERLAKEGRKFGLSLLISTQRPSEVSPTVLAQCGTLCVFRLTNEQDQRSVASASERSEAFIMQQIAGLPRGQAVVFGVAVAFPSRVSVYRPDPEPSSSDTDFAAVWGLGGDTSRPSASLA